MRNADNPEHIAKVNTYIKNLYQSAMSYPDHVAKVFDAPTWDLDKELLWDTFDEVAYEQVFNYTEEGMTEIFNDINVLKQLQESICQFWPCFYYFRILERLQVITRYKPGPGEYQYIIAEPYMPVLSTILKEDVKRAGS